MSEGPNDATFWGVIGGLGAVFGAALGWVWDSANGRVRELREEREKAHRELRDDKQRSHDALWEAMNAQTRLLAEHKVDSEKRYARSEDVQKLREHIDRQFDRVHAKLDDRRQSAAGE